ncbi:MAG: serine acetyltransferase [Planctomycetes bacterium]|nr:serine acetyltransferase [Planctomycetota bacterium]
MREDRARLRTYIERDGAPRPFLIALYPSYACVLMHRISHYFWRRGWHRLGRLIWHLNMVVTGADIGPVSNLGPGLLVPFPAAVSIYGTAGRHLTCMPLSGLGGELGRDEDVGAGPGLPHLGDGVTLGHHAGVLGPVRIGNRVRLGPGCIVASDLEDDASVEPAPIRQLKGRVA